MTILPGFQSAGKITLLNYVPHNRENLKVAGIANDLSEVNIDVAQVKKWRIEPR